MCNEFPRGLGLSYKAHDTGVSAEDDTGFLYPSLLCPTQDVTPDTTFGGEIDHYDSNDMDCDHRGGIKGISVRLHRKAQPAQDRISLNSFAVTCLEDDRQYQKSLVLGYLPFMPDQTWVRTEQSPPTNPWLDAQACLIGTAVFAVQPRVRSEVEHQEVSGITGFRFYCSHVFNAPSTHQDAYPVHQVLEFPGKMGNWGDRLACKDGQCTLKKPSKKMCVLF